MRILLAYDGSDGAGIAARLVETAAWPIGSSVEIVTVIEPELAQLPVGPWPTATTGGMAADDDLVNVLAAKAELDDVAERLGARGLGVLPVVLRGDPREQLLDRIARHRPDLVVTGTRSLGAVRRIVLGSISSALVDRSEAPVLVARDPAIERVLVATDGSEIADEAIAAIARWPFLARSEIRVASVAPDHPIPWPSEMIPGVPPAVIEDLRTDARDLSEHEAIAAAAAGRLSAAGHNARPEVLTGSAGTAITTFARQWGADLVILGSHGRTGVTRIVLGSVARDVLEHATCSVLIVRRHAEPARARHVGVGVPVHALSIH